MFLEFELAHVYTKFCLCKVPEDLLEYYIFGGWALLATDVLYGM